MRGFICRLLGVGKSRSRVEITVTPSAKQWISTVMKQEPDIKGLRVGATYRGFGAPHYELEPVADLRRQKGVRETVDGIVFFIDEDDAEFMDGVIIDYDFDRQGFKFEHSRPNLELIKEYRADQQKRQQEKEEQRKRDLVLSKDVVPEILVKDLLTENRDEAFQKLSAWWRANGLENASEKPPRYLKQVFVTQGSMRRIRYIVLTQPSWSDDEHSAVLNLVSNDGLPEKILGGMNCFDSPIDGVYQFGTSGNYIAISNHACGISRNSDFQSLAGGHQSVQVFMLTGEQRALLEVSYAFHLSFDKNDDWFCSVDETNSGGFEVTFLRDVGDDDLRFTFQWVEAEQRFAGPDSSVRYGFFVRPPNLPWQEYDKRLQPYLEQRKREIEARA